MIALVALAGGVGAMLRYALDRTVGPRLRPGIALACINVLGSLLIGVIAGLALRGVVAPEVRTVLATGVLGGFTTFSAASLDVVEESERHGRVVALRRAFAVPVLACLACAAGLVLSSLG
ncbi:fluoride efflux transporter FluC [Litorihabitans aurantiacus]|uniref:Fluoride-specific ion channel FluC n=1 Tax=Litorihabitans aurantiacus TaxID=1930061 RepID=A0AA37UNA3_9MICO|nr:CrcB family protein [Litorihabitans aurantiacus]GMA30086.1 putative fluoride ion transporter CrcB [Litorihabitans aurantiacus]